MTYTLADAIRAQFERDHPGGKNTLLCVGLCRRRKDRRDFRKTPWHGRAAACLNCEGYGIGGARLWDRTHNDRMAWNLEQAREKLRMYQRYAQWLRLQRLLATAPRTAEVMRAREQPYVDAVEAAVRKWSPLWTQALSKAHTHVEEEV
ncbi:hypothetical protein ACFWM7_01395 [Streptomyces sp. NPDC058375]|uniref:hypothetical protein n=1 Tax=Streptomyces sp. NPDC058375 TaxID=3346467 RepID=UPI00365975FC